MTKGVITVAREVLLPALAAAQQVTERRSTIPILQNVLVEAGDGRLAITGTDLDIEVRHEIAATAGGTSAFTVPATIIHDSVRKLPDGAEIAITVDDTVAVIAAGRSRFRVPVLPAADFPVMGRGDFETSFDLDAAHLARMVATVSFAVSTEETRHYLNGVYWHVLEAEERLLIAVATDGHRLARFALPLPEGAAGMPPVIIPRKTVGLLRKILGDKGMVTVEVSETRIAFSSDGGPHIVSKLVDGTYPDYQRVIPSGNANLFRAARPALTAAIDRVMTISSDRGRAVKLAFDDTLVLSAANPDTGSAEDSIGVERIEGDPVMLGLNGKYCLDMLGAIDAATVDFRMGDAGAPALITPVEGDDPRPSFVIMPMRI